MDIINRILMAFFTFICGYALWKNIKNDESRFDHINQNLYVGLLVAFAVIAVLVRVWQFGEIPGGVHQDGAMAAVDAKALGEYGTDRFGMRLPIHFTAWDYGQMSVFASYLMVPFVKIGGLNAVAMRLPTLLTSLAGLYVVFLLIKEISKDKLLALVVFAFCAINPWHIMQSRWVLDCNFFPHMFLFGVYFLQKGAAKKVYIYISMIFFALCLYCYGIAFYTVPLFLIFMCAYMLWKKLVNWKQAGISAAVFFLLSWPIIAMVFINYFKLESIETPLFTIPFFPNSIRSRDLLFFAEEPLEAFKTNLEAFVNVSVLQKPGLPWNSIPEFGPYFLPSLPFVVIGLYSIIRQIWRSKDNLGLVSIIAFFIMAVWAGLMVRVNVNRINIIFYPLIIIVGYGIAFIVERCKYIRISVIAVYCVLFALFTTAYFTTTAKTIEYHFMKDFSKAVEYIQQIDCEKYYITSYSQFEHTSNVSEILTLFYHEIDAKYFQGEKQFIKPTGEPALPYNERYTYYKEDSINVTPEENAAFVLRDSQKWLFDEDEFDFVEFGLYYVATPK